MILRGVKYRIDLDSIEAKSEERRRIKEAIIQAKRQRSPGYQTAVHPGEVYQKKENRHRENRENNGKQSVTGYKPNKKGENTVIVRDHKHRFKTEEELYKHFVLFGDICTINYMDGSNWTKN